MPERVSISAAGAHGAVDLTDRIPVSKGPFTPGTRGYHSWDALKGDIAQLATSTPSRALNSAGFQPSVTKRTLVSYSLRITCTAALLAPQDGKVELMSDENSTPTTVRATVQNRNSVSISLTAINEQTGIMTYIVPPGHYVRLISTQTVGTPSFSIISQTEQILS